MTPARAIIIQPDRSYNITETRLTLTDLDAFEPVTFKLAAEDEAHVVIWRSSGANNPPNPLAKELWQHYMRWGPAPEDINGPVIVTGGGEIGSIKPVPESAINIIRRITGQRLE